MKKFGHLLSFLIGYIFYLPFKFLPYRICLVYGTGIALMLYPLARKHRKIAAENIRYAFPEKNEKEISELVFKSFLHLGNLLAGTLYASRIDKAWMDKYLEYDEESLRLENDLKKENYGVVICSGHLGNWEILAQIIGTRVDGVGIYKKIRNRFVDRWLFKHRSNNKTILVSTEESTKVIKYLKDGYWVAFGTDQNAGKAGIFVDFLNRKASTFTGSALMAYITGARMLHYTIVYKEKGIYTMRVKDIGFIDKKIFPDRDSAIRLFTEKSTKILEEEIKKNPEQYFWVHRRWRTKPGDFPGQT
ncbi:MAG: lauroyl acyltransferase [Leptospiraceae bacterium]|nr:lauroyl acyltransferase [Leptospiraceae bacterium]